MIRLEKKREKNSRKMKWEHEKGAGKPDPLFCAACGAPRGDNQGDSDQGGLLSGFQMIQVNNPFSWGKLFN